MVICKYFMEGYCRYGSNCRFEHVSSYRGYESPRNSELSSSERPSGTSILKGNNVSFVGQEFNPGFIQNTQQNNSLQKVTPGLKFNVQEIMQIVSKDIIQSEKANQWQLSSYSPVKELPNIPGLEDHSPEELRWECYKAVQNGTLPLWQAIVQQFHSNVAKINSELKKKETGHPIIDIWLRDGEEKYIQSSMKSPFGSSNVPNSDFNAAPFKEARNSSFPLSGSQTPLTNMQPFMTSGPSSLLLNQTTTIPTSNQKTKPYSPDYSQAYSIMKDLTEQELEAFKAERFIVGAIPTKPPPKELCNL